MLDPLHPLFSAVIDVLTHTGNLSMNDLQKQLKARGIKTSTPTLYRTVGQMISTGVLVRGDGRLSFSPTWMQELKTMAGKISSASSKRIQPAAQAPAKAKKQLLPKVQDRSQSLIMRKIRSFMGQRTATADLIAED